MHVCLSVMFECAKEATAPSSPPGLRILFLNSLLTRDAQLLACCRNKEGEGKCRLDIYYLLYLFTYPRVPYLKHGVENTLGVIGIKWFFIVDVIKKSKGVQCKVYQGFDVDEAA